MFYLIIGKCLVNKYIIWFFINLIKNSILKFLLKKIIIYTFFIFQINCPCQLFLKRRERDIVSMSDANKKKKKKQQCLSSGLCY